VRAALVAIVLLAGCRTPRDAVVRGQRVERPSFGYSDGFLFAVDHRRAYPDVFAGNRPYYVDDGELGGRACGLDLQFFSEWYGNMMTLYGRGSTPMPWLVRDTRGGVAVTLTIDELGPGHLRIRGSTHGFATFPIDIDVSADRLVAQIGTRHVDLYPVGHWLVGPLVQDDIASSIEAPFAIYGREMLRTMVPADEALVLLMMITCNGTIEYGGRPERGFSLVSSPEAQIGVVPETKTTVIRGDINPRGWNPPPAPAAGRR
jgi:hypothetical protein